MGGPYITILRVQYIPMHFFKLQYLTVPAETRETGSFRRSIEPERPRFLPADEIVDFAASVGSLDFLADA